MTPTHWLLLGWVVFIFAVMGINHMINAEWKDSDQLTYRTADGAAIARQTRRIIAKASAHASARPGSDCCCNLATARREGTAAALHERGAA